MAQPRPLGLQQRFASLAMQASLALAVCLPFVLPFDTARNIDAQGLLIIVIGGFAWGALILKPSFWKRLLPWQWVLVGLYMLAGLVSVVVNPHVGYDLLGAPYIRLGAGGLLACVGFGLLVTDLPRQRLVSYLYMDILLLALVSIPYSLLKFHTLRRFGGVFAQADIMACLLYTSPSPRDRQKSR